MSIRSRKSIRPRSARAASWVAAVFMCVPSLVLPLAWHGYSPVAQTVSALAAVGAPTRAAMTACAMVTAVALALQSWAMSWISWLPRAFLAAAALAAAMSLVYPQPAPDADTPMHTAAVASLSVFLGLWPLAALADMPGLRSMTMMTVGVTLALIVLGLLFLGQWLVDAPLLGVAERTFMVSELAANVVFTRLHQRRLEA